MSRAPKAKKPVDLDSALQLLGLGDAAFGEKCSPALQRSVIWKIRTGRRIPRGDTADNILKTLQRSGVVLALDQLLNPRRTRRHAA